MKKYGVLLAASTIASLFLGACLVLKLTPEDFQRFVLHFELTEAISVGQFSSVYVAVYPKPVGIKRKWIKISGKLVPSQGGSLPDRVVVQVQAELVETGQKLPKLQLAIAINTDGTFKGVKRNKRDFPAGMMQTIRIQPQGSALQAGTQLWLCIDVFQKKEHALNSSDCGVEASPPPPGAGDVVIVNIVDNAFSPQQATIQPGDTVRWVLDSNDPSHTTTAMAGTWDSGFVFNAQGAFFERTFPQAEDGQTFQYFCVTHQACCQMQGSVLVGENAPPPPPGY